MERLWLHSFSNQFALCLHKADSIQLVKDEDVIYGTQGTFGFNFKENKPRGKIGHMKLA